MQQRNCILTRTYLQTLGEHTQTALKTTSTMATEKFRAEFLAAHNEFRRKHKAPPLTFRAELNTSAQEFADHLASIDKLEHSSTKDGENVFFASGMEVTGKDPVQSWYGEIKDYDFNNPGFGCETGHFTQVVWKDTKQVGVGMATKDNKVYVVGQYRPAGNVNIEECFEANVLSE